ncbi:MAG: hypothetical protein R6W81_01230 [Bacteroidales bacterium]
MASISGAAWCSPPDARYPMTASEPDAFDRAWRIDRPRKAADRRYPAGGPRFAVSGQDDP